MYTGCDVHAELFGNVEEDKQRRRLKCRKQYGIRTYVRTRLLN